MFRTISKLSKPFNTQIRSYWFKPESPSTDIINTLKTCLKYELSYPVTKKYSNVLFGGSVKIDKNILLGCKNFQQTKNNFEKEKYVINILSHDKPTQNHYSVVFNSTRKTFNVYI